MGKRVKYLDQALPWDQEVLVNGKSVYSDQGAGVAYGWMLAEFSEDAPFAQAWLADWEEMQRCNAETLVVSQQGGTSVAVGSVRAATANFKHALKRKPMTLAATYREPSHVNWSRVREAREAGRRVRWAHLQDDFDRKPKSVK